MRALRVFFLLILIGVLGWTCYTYLLPGLGVTGQTPGSRPDRDTGLTRFREGDYEGAAKYLKRAASRGTAEPGILLPLGKSLIELGRVKEAEKFLGQLVKEQSLAAECPEALYLLANAATEDAAKTGYRDELLAKHYDTEWAEKASIPLGDAHYAGGRLFEARGAYSRALHGNVEAKERERIIETLTKLNEKLVFSRAETPDSVVYTVKQGDTLEKIAKKYGTTVGLIKMVNKIEGATGTIYENQDLKVITSSPEVLVETDAFRLTVFLGDHWLKEYPVGVGKEGEETPIGKWKVTTMTPNPDWHKPGKTIPFGDPANILGTRWIGLTKKGYGIHGTTKPDTIRTASSAGCVRMLNKDVEELFELVTTGTDVEIK